MVALRADNPPTPCADTKQSLPGPARRASVDKRAANAHKES